jgi:DeoR/GlpR family transcriptional regulator of sugar metabolism
MMLPQQRRQKILEMLQEEGAARVHNLSDLFGVSEPTIRQDLVRLESEGLVVREHGGAFLKSVPDQVRSMSLHHTENMAKKTLIARKAAEYISDGDSVILDSGTTITEVARCLEQKSNLRIITDSLNIALLLGGRSDFVLMVTGGEFKAPTLSVTGDKAAQFFDQIHVDKLLLAVGGISLEAGLTYPGFSDIPVKTAMIESAGEVFVLADSTKMGKTSFAALGKLENVDYLITDNEIDPGFRRQLENIGITVVPA